MKSRLVSLSSIVAVSTEFPIDIRIFIWDSFMAARGKAGSFDTLAADDSDVRFSTLLPAELAGSRPYAGRVKAAIKTRTKANTSFILRSSHRFFNIAPRFI
jgi:hypothetical protein